VLGKQLPISVLRIFGTKGNVGTVFEYGGPGVGTLSAPERATIANMGAECGVTTSVFPSDGTTRAFLESQGRVQDWIELEADADAEYDKTVDINLSELVPLAATPHSPGNVAEVEGLGGVDVDQVCIGSCTNSSYTDLAIVAKMLKGKVVAPGVSLVVAPGSKQVLQNVARSGLLEDLIAAGARLDESACGFCIGNSQSPASKGVSLRTSNRNFEGRSGTKDAQVYLVSPETAAAAAITGRITDPRSIEMKYPRVRAPKRFLIDDGMFIFPKDVKEPSKVQIVRGPNIGAPPVNTPFPEDIKGVVSIKVGDKITTDHIIPAGARMKYRSNVPKYSEYVFEAVDATFSSRAARIRDGGRHNIIVGGASYGEGSSREHAAICPMFLGVKAVLAKSFQRIHTDNLVNFGILPLTFKSEADYAKIAQGDEIEIKGVTQALREGGPILARNPSKGVEFELAHSLSGRQKEILLAGGALSLQKTKSG
jgi:aconitate hydratase